MKRFIKLLLILALVPIINFNADKARKPKLLAYKYIHSYYRHNGTYVRGHWRDTSNDGYKYNNANYWGMNNE